MNAVPLVLAVFAQFSPPVAIEPTEERPVASVDDYAPPVVVTATEEREPAPIDASQYLPPIEPRDTNSTRRDVQPAQAMVDVREPMQPVHAADRIELARQLIDRATQDQLDSETDLPLVAILERHQGRTSQLKAVRAYWQLSMQVARRAFAGADVRFLRQLPEPNTALEQALLTAELASTEARLAHDELLVMKLQQQLETGDQRAGFPVDTPFVGTYRTEYRRLFANRPAPARLRQIQAALPRELRLIETAAAAVDAREAALQEAALTYQEGQILISTVLDLMKQLGQERTQFLNAVRSYNERIAEYSLAVVAPNTSPERLAGTLIRSPHTTTSPEMVADSRFRQASLESTARDGRQRSAAFREVGPPAESTRRSRNVLRKVPTSPR